MRHELRHDAFAMQCYGTRPMGGDLQGVVAGDGCLDMGRIERFQAMKHWHDHPHGHGLLAMDIPFQ